MRHLLRTILPLAVLLSAPSKAQTPVEIAFQSDPVQVRTGNNILFTVLTVSDVFSITWVYQGRVTLALWSNGVPSVKPVAQFQGRVTITATTLQISSAALTDAGQYTVTVDPNGEGLAPNSKSVTLNVFDAVTGVSLFLPLVSVEGKNISLTCTHQAGTNVAFLWSKDSNSLAPNARITISGGSLVINPAQRGDAGDYKCTVSNPISALSATQTLTVYYGPDTPVLTKDTAKDCVGAGDVWTGKTITLTCTSVSLPRAQFSWQFDGQAVSSADTGQLSVQTSSTSQSGRYTCTAKNAITGLSSEQGTDLVVTDVCLDAGEVVGIVIGSFILLLILIILIILLARFIMAKRRRREASTVQTTTNANPRPLPENPPANVGRDLALGPPLYHGNAEPRRANHLYTAPVPGRNGDGQRQTLNTQNNSATSQHNGIPLANGLRHNAIQNSNNPNPHNGIDNPAFTQNELQTAPQQQMQNPDIVIQTGSTQVRLNTSQRTAQQNDNGQIPTIHVNLNSYSGDQQTPMGSVGLPVAAVDEATQTPQNERRATSTLRTPMLDRHRAVLQTDPGLIPTGYTHYNRNPSAERISNRESEVYNQQSEPRVRSDSSSSQPAPRRQLPWDTLRGTPSYPSNNQRRVTSDSTDYTMHPPLPQARSRSRERQEQPRERENRRPSREREMESQARTERRSPRDDMRGRRESRAPRQEGRHDNSPPALPLMSQDFPAGRPLVQSQPDMRALVDPNHLPHSQARQQATQMPQMVQTSRRMMQENQAANRIPPTTNQTPQSDRAANHIPQTRQLTRSQLELTQEALQVHTERSQAFQNRRQQTAAALLHPGPQANRAPTPPPVIPLQQFEALPKERTRQREARPPVNMPMAQRPHHAHHRNHATVPQNHHHRHQHHPQTHQHTAHRQAQAQAQAHTWQQQAHRGRPR